MVGLSVIVVSSIISATAAGAAAFHLLRDRSHPRSRQNSPDQDLHFLFRGSELVNVTGGGEWLFESGQGIGKTDWQQLYHVMAPRFPGFFSDPTEMDTDIVSCPAGHANDPAELLIERIKDLVRVTLLQPGVSSLQPEDFHQRQMIKQRLETLEAASDNSPYPVWSTGQDGQITWANATYLLLADNAKILDPDGNIPVLFDLPDIKPPANPRTRLSVNLPESDSNIWFDITSTETGVGRMHYAVDINAVVQAEIAQRNFVQTLTKTFAQLSIGLAIFDRRRQLALFNPALIDLIGLSPEYLSGRPTLPSFFDKLRDSQIMPEPKNYHSWREEMQELVTAASDGRYMETWNLSNGLTYRISGRPHPDGAIAFLFEDISSEVSLTRRFRSQLEVLQTVLDGLPQAVAVFSPSGVLSFANGAYRTRWNSDPDSSFAEITIGNAIAHWKGYCAPDADLSLLQTGTIAEIDLPLITGEKLNCRVRPLIGGSFAVIFGEGEITSACPALERIA